MHSFNRKEDIFYIQKEMLSKKLRKKKADFAKEYSKKSNSRISKSLPDSLLHSVSSWAPSAPKLKKKAKTIGETPLDTPAIGEVHDKHIYRSKNGRRTHSKYLYDALIAEAQSRSRDPFKHKRHKHKEIFKKTKKVKQSACNLKNSDASPANATVKEVMQQSGSTIDALRADEEQFQNELQTLEKKIYDIETDYLRCTQCYGNVIQGFSKLLSLLGKSGKTPQHFGMWKKMSESSRVADVTRVTQTGSKMLYLTPKRSLLLNPNVSQIESEGSKLEPHDGLTEGPPPGYIPVEWENVPTFQTRNPFKSENIDDKYRVFSLSSITSPATQIDFASEDYISKLVEEQLFLTEKLPQEAPLEKHAEEPCAIEWQKYLKRKAAVWEFLKSLGQYKEVPSASSTTQHTHDQWDSSTGCYGVRSAELSQNYLHKGTDDINATKIEEKH